MTLQELVNALDDLNYTGRYTDLPVRIEGCDCTGAASGVELDTIGGERVVLVRREDSEW